MLPSLLAITSPFQAIQYVGTPLTLVAFVVAVAAWIYRARLAERRKLIESAPEDQRAEMMVAAIRDFSTVPLENLTKQQRFQLALKLIDERRDRFRIMAVIAAVAAIALVVVILTTGRTDATTALVVRVHGPDGRGDLVRQGSVLLDAGDLRLTATVGPDGQARFENLPPSAYTHGVTIEADVPGMESVAALALSAPPDGGAVYLALQPRATTVRGTVVSDDARRLPLAGVLVDVDGGAATDTTDGGGHFQVTVSHPPGSRVAVRLVREGRVGFDDTVVISEDQPLILHFSGDGEP